MKSIRSKVLASILLITLLTAAAITAVFYWKSAQLVEENYVAVLYQKERLLIETIDRTMEQVCHINVEASCDEELKSNAQLYLQSGEEMHLEQLAEILGIYAKRNTQISSLYFLMPENAVLVTSKEYPVYKRGLDQRLAKEVLTFAREQTGLLVLPDMGSKDSKVLAFAEPVTDGEGQLLGYLFANMEETRVYYDYLAPKEEDLIKEMVLLKGEQIIASGGLGEVGSIYEKADTHKEWMQGSDMAGADEENIYIYCKGSFSQCGLFAEVEREKILGDLTQIRNYFFGMMGVILLLSLLPAFYITHVVYSPLKKLTSTMRRVSEGELENRAEVVSQDEIGVLAADFNRMLDRIEELIHQLITEEKNKKDAELEALQYQITPHFMYNTLNSIKCAAMIKGDRELGNIIGNFVELLQAAISKKGTFLTVAEEVHILQNYIHLQEFTDSRLVIQWLKSLEQKLGTAEAQEYGSLHSMDQVYGRMEASLDVRKRSVPVQIPEKAGKTVRIAAEYVRNHYREAIGLTDAAQAANVNSAYLSYLFRQEMGVGFSSFLLEQRMEYARNMLKETNLKIRIVAEEAGFNDYHYFSKTFKKLNGQSPADYRQKN